MSYYSCDCGKLKKPKSFMNDIIKDLVCFFCNSKLKISSEAIQTKLDSFNNLDEAELSKMRRLIFNELSLAPATDRELTKRLGFNDPNKVRPRRKELFDMKKIKDIKKRPCCITGKKVIEWGVI